MLSYRMVPARVGGVDLSCKWRIVENIMKRPRPCGRGGFKLISDCKCFAIRCPRPCGRGGFKLDNTDAYTTETTVPARVGGVDLSYVVQ